MPNYIKMLQLQSHVEGGYFAVFYQSTDKVIPCNERYHQQSENGPKEYHAGSSIYFLLEKKGFSAWHRLKSDEVWHYYDGGSPIDIHVIDNGELKTYTLGHPALTTEASFQVIIKAGLWFAAEVRDQSSFGLVGCTVSPAFEYDDFELAEKYRDTLVKAYPHLQEIIDKFITPTTSALKKNTDLIEHTTLFIKNKLSAKDYIQQLHLAAHAEGGYFCVNYKADDQVQPLSLRYQEKNKKSNAGEKKSYRFSGSSIYFLLEKKGFSAWHRLKSDEVWHYYDGGSPIDIHVIDNGELKTYTLGHPALTTEASFQVIIKAGLWFAAEVRDQSSFGLVGCTVSPAFEYDDFELANRDDLSAEYPAHESIIKKLTRVETKSCTRSAIAYATLALVSGIELYTLTHSETANEYISHLKIPFGH